MKPIKDFLDKPTISTITESKCTVIGGFSLLSNPVKAKYALTGVNPIYFKSFDILKDENFIKQVDEECLKIINNEM